MANPEGVSHCRRAMSRTRHEVRAKPATSTFACGDHPADMLRRLFRAGTPAPPAPSAVDVFIAGLLGQNGHRVEKRLVATCERAGGSVRLERPASPLVRDMSIVQSSLRDNHRNIARFTASSLVDTVSMMTRTLGEASTIFRQASTIARVGNIAKYPSG